MAQTIKHRRGKLESIAGSVTPINGELIIASGSDLAVHQEGLLFVGVEGNVLTPSNKILTGSATLDVTGGSYDHSIDGVPYYETDAKKLTILGKGGNTDVELAHGQIDFGGSTILSGSLTAPNNNTITFTPGPGLDGGGSITLNQSSDETITFTVSDGVVSGSSQVDAASVTNFDSEVDARMNAKTVISGSSQVNANSITNFDTNVRAAVSATGDISYDSATGVFSFTNDAGDIESVTAGTGLSGGGSSGAVTLNFTGDGTGVVSGSVLRPGGDDVISGSSQVSIGSTTGTLAVNKGGTGATTAAGARTNLGVDAAGTDNSTDVTLAGSYDYITISGQEITRNQITNDDLAGSIANGKLANSAITISGTSVSLGSSITDEVLFGGTGVVSGSSQVTGIGNSQLSNSSVTIGDSTISLGGTDTTLTGLTDIDMTAADHTILNGVGANTLTIGASTTDVVIAGNLTVSGTNTVVNSTTVQYDDNILELNGGGAANGGIHVKDAEGSNSDTGSIIWDTGEDYWAAGVAGSEKEIARLNASPTSNTVLKANGSGLLVDSAISDNGTAVTISSNLIISGLTASQVVVTNASKQLTSSTDISSLTLTLDGGTF